MIEEPIDLQDKAYWQARAERAEAEVAWHELEQNRLKVLNMNAEAEIIRLREALEWYADDKHYVFDEQRRIVGAHVDGGERARACLSAKGCAGYENPTY